MAQLSQILANMWPDRHIASHMSNGPNIRSKHYQFQSLKNMWPVRQDSSFAVFQFSDDPSSNAFWLTLASSKLYSQMRNFCSLRIVYCLQRYQRPFDEGRLIGLQRIVVFNLVSMNRQQAQYQKSKLKLKKTTRLQGIYTKQKKTSIFMKWVYYFIYIH